MSKPKSIYVFAQYYAKPKNPKMTRIAGYMSDPNNIVWDERIDVTHGLKDRDRIAAKVIINISEQTVERDGFNSGKSFDELFSYFYEANPKQIADAIRRFGITVRKTDVNAISEDVQGKEEETGRPERAAEAELDVASEGDQERSSIS